MEWMITLLYIGGAILTHCILYKDVSDEDREDQTASIACILWPIVLLIITVLFVERIIKKILDAR